VQTARACLTSRARPSGTRGTAARVCGAPSIPCSAVARGSARAGSGGLTYCGGRWRRTRALARHVQGRREGGVHCPDQRALWQVLSERLGERACARSRVTRAARAPPYFLPSLPTHPFLCSEHLLLPACVHGRPVFAASRALSLSMCAGRAVVGTDACFFHQRPCHPARNPSQATSGHAQATPVPHSLQGHPATRPTGGRPQEDTQTPSLKIRTSSSRPF
jgi:hypothetical protein